MLLQARHNAALLPRLSGLFLRRHDRGTIPLFKSSARDGFQPVLGTCPAHLIRVRQAVASATLRGAMENHNSAALEEGERLGLPVEAGRLALKGDSRNLELAWPRQRGFCFSMLGSEI